MSSEQPTTNSQQRIKIGILGAGTMGAGIAQVAASAGHKTILFDANPQMLLKAKENLNKTMISLLEKGKISKESSDSIIANVFFAENITDFKHVSLLIEAIIEDLQVKQKVFKELEEVISKECILASNTSSLSITSIAAACSSPARVVGIHFFNPAPLMPLVEIIPAVSTSKETLESSRALIDSWNKVTVLAKDTPGFIVNRVARSYYGESIRIMEEGIADIATIDWAMKEMGGFKMGPFELMDFIGNDINYKVTETVWEQFFYEPRFKPSFTQKRLYEAKYYGRKSGRGYYDYTEGAIKPEPNKNKDVGQKIFLRVLSMLINEAADTLYLGIACKEDIDLAMTKGLNYPKGLLAWADEVGVPSIYKQLKELYEEYNEDRYRPCVLLKRMAVENKTFYEKKLTV